MSFCPHGILSMSHFSIMALSQNGIKSEWHFVNMAFCQHGILSLSHFPIMALSKNGLLSTRRCVMLHFVSLWPFVNKAFCHLVFCVIMAFCQSGILPIKKYLREWNVERGWFEVFKFQVHDEMTI
jgi:hypothetical protein